MKKKLREKVTLRKYFDIAEQIRASGNYTLDIREYEPRELLAISTLVQSDAIFEFVSTVKDMDVCELYATMKFLEAEEKMYKSRTSYRSN